MRCRRWEEFYKKFITVGIRAMNEVFFEDLFDSNLLSSTDRRAHASFDRSGSLFQ